MIWRLVEMNENANTFVTSIFDCWGQLIDSPEDNKLPVFPNEKFQQPPLYIQKKVNESGPVPVLWIRHEKSKVKLKPQRYRGFDIEIKDGAFGVGPTDHFIVISCNELNYIELFLKFSQNIVDLIEVGQLPSEAARTCVKDWLEFFKRNGTILDESNLIGLFGELSFIKELIVAKAEINQVVDAWRGPRCEPWDFTLSWMSPVHCVEVKTTIKPKTQITVHGLDQLWAAKQNLAYWLNFRMVNFHQIDDQSTRGSIVEIVDELRAFIGNKSSPHVLSEFNDALAQAGYTDEHKDYYLKQKIQLFDSKWYSVTDAFPSLTRNTVQKEIFERLEKLSYTLNLNGLMDEKRPIK